MDAPAGCTPPGPAEVACLSVCIERDTTSVAHSSCLCGKSSRAYHPTHHGTGCVRLHEIELRAVSWRTYGRALGKRTGQQNGPLRLSLEMGSSDDVTARRSRASWLRCATPGQG